MADTPQGGIMRHVHPRLQRRMRLFIGMGVIMFLLVIWDISQGTMSIGLALVGIVIGALVGVVSSRIFHLSWDHDGQQVVGRVDAIGWFILAAYIVFEIIRATLFETVIHTAYTSTAITFTFVSAALISRVFGLRGRISRILKEEKILG